ncbi:hypothetical protein NQ317_006660 [Molorchus minor]|uniref:Peptidase aspartic putative domain-containing protein n=1 Tax=Molorchus minor TaxID=1323400 RepID=A0ABQ9JVG3_9CUCU|nr:hypothetical protein NQ317_006660 [Molorchus minor]
MSTTNADKIKRYKAYRTTQINKIQELNAVAEKALVDIKVHTLFKLRYSEIDVIKEEFAKQHISILSLIATAEEINQDEEENIREQFEHKFYSIKTIYTDLFESSLNRPTTSSSSASTNFRSNSATVTRFEMNHGSLEVPTYSALVSFLEKHCIALDTLNFGSSANQDNTFKTKVTPKPKITNRNSSHSSLFVKTYNACCALCKGNHPLYKCNNFTMKTPTQRYEFVKNSRLCLNCLSDVHVIKNCNSKSVCRKCTQRHHTLLHFDQNYSSHTSVEPRVEPRVEPTADTPQAVVASTSNTVNSFTGLSPRKGTVLLSTALVEILDGFGNHQTVRALIDSGSQVSFITQKCANRLNLSRYNLSLSIQGLGKSQTATRWGAASVVLRPLKQHTPSLTVEVAILPKICSDLPTFHLTTKSWTHIERLQLADPNFYSPGAIDLLLGADVFPHLLLDEKVTGMINEPVALKTIFGYILVGKVQPADEQVVQSLFCSTANISLDRTLKQFWELENIPDVEANSPDDAACEKIFVDSFYRNDNAAEEKSNFPLAADVITQSTYIDDVVVSSPSLAHARELQSQLISLLALGGFELQIHNALLTLVRFTQKLAFADDLARIKQKLQPSKPLSKLAVFIDDNDILRVGGRLYFSKLSYDKKYPALLPRQSRLTELIIQSLHVKRLHVGSQTLHFLIAQQFWILSAKRAIRGVLSKCVACWKTQPTPYEPPMGNLPRWAGLLPFRTVYRKSQKCISRSRRTSLRNEESSHHHISDSPRRYHPTYGDPCKSSEYSNSS